MNNEYIWCTSVVRLFGWSIKSIGQRVTCDHIGIIGRHFPPYVLHQFSHMIISYIFNPILKYFE